MEWNTIADILTILLVCWLIYRQERHMATLQETLTAAAETAAAERAEVLSALGVLKDTIQALRDQIANGVEVTDEQLSGLLSNITGIYNAEDSL